MICESCDEGPGDIFNPGPKKTDKWPRSWIFNPRAMEILSSKVNRKKGSHMAYTTEQIEEIKIKF